MGMGTQEFIGNKVCLQTLRCDMAGFMVVCGIQYI